MTRKPAEIENEKLELLLPWYVNGTLDAGNRRRIDDALARDGRLRRSLELALEDREATLHVNERIKAPSVDPLSKIMTAVSSSSRATAFALKQSLAERFKAFVGSLSPRVLAVAAIAAAIVLTVQAAAIGMLSVGQNEGQGMVLASGDGHNAENTIGFIVRFAPDVTIARATGLLEELGLNIVDGPAGGGLYVVEVPLSEETGPEGEKVLLQMQARSDIVAFVAKAPAREN